MLPDPDQGQRDSVRERDHVLQGEERHPRRGQRGRLRRVCAAAGRHHAEERAGDHDAGGDLVSQGEHRQGDEGGWGEIIKAVYDMYSISYIERRTDEKFEYQISTKIYELVEMHDENREIFT